MRQRQRVFLTILLQNPFLLLMEKKWISVPENAAARLTELLGRQELIIQKRTKRKELADVDIAPMIKGFSFTEMEGAVTGTVTVLAQNPGLNPQLLEKAVVRYLPDLTPDFLRVRRRAVLDAEGRDFR